MVGISKVGKHFVPESVSREGKRQPSSQKDGENKKQKKGAEHSAQEGPEKKTFKNFLFERSF